PVACRMLRLSISPTDAKPTPQATALALISTSSASRVLAVSFLESSSPLGMRRGFSTSRITAAAHTGPAHRPRPASSTPPTRPLRPAPRPADKGLLQQDGRAPRHGDEAAPSP